MPRAIPILFCFLMSVLLSGASEQPGAAVAFDKLVSAYVQSYNDRDIKGMQALMHDEIEWIDISGYGQTIITDSKEDLVTELEKYFEGATTTNSELTDWSVNGRFVSVTEIGSWMNAEQQKKSQAAISVYEFENNLIRRIWYFPAQPR